MEEDSALFLGGILQHRQRWGRGWGRGGHEREHKRRRARGKQGPKRGAGDSRRQCSHRAASQGMLCLENLLAQKLTPTLQHCP